MQDEAQAGAADGETWERKLSQWRQGDYSLTLAEILTVDGLIEEDGILPDVAAAAVPGLVVVTQTCDIVNAVPGKDYVVVCPLKMMTEQALEDVRKGRSPAAAVLEHPPQPNLVVDLGRMMSIHKSVLARMERRDGFSTDAGRTRFAEALERKHGRFAFPDSFNDHVLAKLRDRILGAHGKPTSENGKAYRSIQTARVTAAPHWEAPDLEVTFHFILVPEDEREATRAQIAKTLDDHLGKITWPSGIRAAKPLYIMTTMEEMTAATWTQSQPIDWDFISSAGRVVAAQQP
jgi:hypothetical protein